VSDTDALIDELSRIAVPLITIDAAELYVITATPSEVHLHLSGTYSGCPGREFVERSLLAPIVREILPKATLKVTTGARPPGREPLR